MNTAASAMASSSTCRDAIPVLPCRRRSTRYRFSFTHASNPLSTNAPLSVGAVAAAAAKAASLVSGDTVTNSGDCDCDCDCESLQSQIGNWRSSVYGTSANRTGDASQSAPADSTAEFSPLRAIRTFHHMTMAQRISDISDIDYPDEGYVDSSHGARYLDASEERVSLSSSSSPCIIDPESFVRFTSNAYYSRCYDRLQALKIAKRRESQIHPNQQIEFIPDFDCFVDRGENEAECNSFVTSTAAAAPVVPTTVSGSSETNTVVFEPMYHEYDDSDDDTMRYSSRCVSVGSSNANCHSNDVGTRSQLRPSIKQPAERPVKRTGQNQPPQRVDSEQTTATFLMADEDNDIPDDEDTIGTNSLGEGENEDDENRDHDIYPIQLQRPSCIHATARLLDDEQGDNSDSISSNDDDCFAGTNEDMEIIRKAAERLQVIQNLPAVQTSDVDSKLAKDQLPVPSPGTAAGTMEMRPKRGEKNSKTKLRPVRRVLRFACNVRVRNTLSLNDYTPKEIQQCWYQDRDYDAIVRDSFLLIHRYEASNGNMRSAVDRDDSTIRGLEKMTTEGLRRRDRHLSRAYSAVLDEQDYQRDEYGRVDDQVLAEVYYAMTSKSQRRARKTGKADAKVALEILQGDEADNVAAVDVAALTMSERWSVGNGSLSTIESVVGHADEERESDGLADREVPLPSTAPAFNDSAVVSKLPPAYPRRRSPTAPAA